MSKSSVIVLSILIIIIVYVVKTGENSPEDGLILQSVYPQKASGHTMKEYTQLFRPETKLVLTPHGTIERNYKRPFSSYYYGNGYYIMIHKLSSGFVAPVKSAVIQINDQCTLDNKKWAASYTQGGIVINDFIDRPGDPSIVNFSLFGNHTRKIINNDTIACYYSYFKNISISYGHERRQQMYIEHSDDFTDNSIPMEVLFLKRNHNLYLLLMYTRGNNTKLKPGMLPGLLK